jgi:hypothetical protein
MAWWAVAVGYSYSTLVAHLPIYWLMTAIRRSLGYDPGPTNFQYPEYPSMLGILERSLYTASWQFGKPEFIGLWLLLKVAGQYKEWAEGMDIQNKHIRGRILLDVFLIGNGFSVGYAVLGALLIDWLNRPKPLLLPALTVPFILIIATLWFWWWERGKQFH